MKRLALGLLAVLLIAGCGGTSPRHQAPQKPARTLTAPCPGYQTRYGCQAHSPAFGLHQKQTPAASRVTVPTVTMLDSVDSFSVFSGLHYTALAGYSDGFFQSYPDFRAHFQRVVAIVVHSGDRGVHGAALSCADDEPGDMTNSELTGWIIAEHAAGFKLCVYTNLDNWLGANLAIAAAHLPSNVKVYRWDANWTGSPHLDAGFDATQWNNNYDGRNIDPDVATPAFVNLSQPKPPPPTPVCFGPKAQVKNATCIHARAQVNGLNRDKVLTFNAGKDLSAAMGVLHCAPPRKRAACVSLQASRVVLLKDLAFDKATAAALVKKYS